jgi:DNA-binding NarL/FixJ family response regulator
VPLRCLIVEDQVMFLQLLCKMLQGLPGLEVVGTATSRHGGLEACRLNCSGAELVRRAALHLGRVP